MSTRRSFRFALPLFAAVVLSAGAAFSISACSSSTDDGGTPADVDSGADAGRIKVDAAAPDDDAGEPPTTDECIATCRAAHPSSLTKEDAIDTCWSTSCGPSCVDGTDGFDAGPDGAPDSGPDPLCGTGVSTDSPDCDNCTEANCCAVWTGCFNDEDCSTLDDCIQQCYQQ
jgi:hypothetical protein